MIVITAIAILLVTIYFKVAYDFKLWQRHIPVNHPKEITIIAIPVSVSIFLLAISTDYALPYNYLVSLFLCSSWYFFLFNGFYNLVRRYNWWFIGTPDANDSWTERFFRAIGMPTTIALQLLLILISTYFYFIA